MQKLFFIVFKQFQTTLRIVYTQLFLIDCEQTQHPLWAQLSHWQIFIPNGESTAFWYLQILCFLTQLQLTIDPNEFMEFYVVFRDSFGIWVSSAFSIIRVRTTAFKINSPRLNHCFRRNRVRITLIKYLLCLNRIFSIRKQCFINTRNSDFSIVLKICESSFTKITEMCKLTIRMGSNFCHVPFEG